MTKNKMPDVIYGWCCFGLGEMAHYGASLVKGNVQHTKYLRAETVEALLRQAREALIKSRAYAIGGKDKDVISLNAVTAIDEFLGEEK